MQEASTVPQVQTLADFRWLPATALSTHWPEWGVFSPFSTPQGDCILEREASQKAPRSRGKKGKKQSLGIRKEFSQMVAVGEG